MTRTGFSPRHALLAVSVVAAATIGGALASQHVFGLVPCKLCLWQRWPYYVGLPLAIGALVAMPARALRPLLAALALVFLASAGLGAYHAGVEWGIFLGPSDCGGGSGPAAAGVEDFMRQLNRVRVVSCTEAAWRFAGLSLAGWNALISAALAVFAAWSAYGSSSVSQYR